MRAIVSINTGIHHLCLNILGGASGRQGSSIFHDKAFSLQRSQSAPIYMVLAAPGSAPLRLRRAGLVSVASVEECDECHLHHSQRYTCTVCTQTICAVLMLGFATWHV